MDANNDGKFDTCSSCSDSTTYTDPTTGQCLSCSSTIKNCKECNGSTRMCSRCESGFYILNLVGQTQLQACVTCNEPGQFKDRLDSLSGLGKPFIYYIQYFLIK